MAKFSRRHYVEVAALIASMSPRSRRKIAEKFADKFAADNSAFQRGKFMRACGCEKVRSGPCRV